MPQELHPLVVNNLSFGKLNGVTLFVTQDLFDRLTTGDGCRNPTTLANYIEKTDLHQLELAKDISRAYSGRLDGPGTVLRPRAFILIGTEAGWTDSHREAYQSLNYSLHGIEVITYGKLLRRGEKIVDLYSGESKQTTESR